MLQPGTTEADVLEISRTAESRDLFNYLADNDQLPTVDSLGVSGLRKLLKGAY